MGCLHAAMRASWPAAPEEHCTAHMQPDLGCTHGSLAALSSLTAGGRFCSVQAAGATPCPMLFMGCPAQSLSMGRYRVQDRLTGSRGTLCSC